MDHHDDDNDDDYNFCNGGNDNDNKDESHCKAKKDHVNFPLFRVAMMRLCSATLKDRKSIFATYHFFTIHTTSSLFIM